MTEVSSNKAYFLETTAEASSRRYVDLLLTRCLILSALAVAVTTLEKLVALKCLCV